MKIVRPRQADPPLTAEQVLVITDELVSRIAAFIHYPVIHVRDEESDGEGEHILWWVRDDSMVVDRRERAFIGDWVVYYPSTGKAGAWTDVNFQKTYEIIEEKE